MDDLTSYSETWTEDSILAIVEHVKVTSVSYFSAIKNELKIQAERVLDFSFLDTDTQVHLEKVYATLTLGTVMSVLGTASTHYIFNDFYPLIAFIGVLNICLFLSLLATSFYKINVTLRLLLFAVFTFVQGMLAEPILKVALAIDPTLVSTSLLGTTTVFLSFTLSALLNRNRSYLYLGGFLMTTIITYLVVHIADQYLNNETFFTPKLYFALMLFCGYVLYDTQVIIEKHMNGDNDFVYHAIMLFLDVINIFTSIFVILLRKRMKKE